MEDKILRPLTREEIETKDIKSLLINEEGRCKGCNAPVLTPIVKREMYDGKINHYICECGFCIISIKKR